MSILTAFLIIVAFSFIVSEIIMLRLYLASGGNIWWLMNRNTIKVLQWLGVR